MIEFILYMGLLGIMLVVITDLFTSIIELKLDTESLSAVEQDGRYLYLKLSYDVSRADTFTVNDLNPDELILNIGGTDYTYSIVNGDLIYSYGLVSEKLNSSDTTISDLSFEAVGTALKAKTVRINYAINSVTETVRGKKQILYSTTLKSK